MQKDRVDKSWNNRSESIVLEGWTLWYSLWECYQRRVGRRERIVISLL